MQFCESLIFGLHDIVHAVFVNRLEHYTLIKSLAWNLELATGIESGTVYTSNPTPNIQFIYLPIIIIFINGGILSPAYSHHIHY